MRLKQLILALFVILLVPLILPLQAWAVALPELPRTSVDTTYAPPAAGTLHHVNAGDNLQTAINNAQPGDIIELEAGATFTGNFVFPNKTGDGWIYIRSSAHAQLPAPGTRVTPSDASLMAKIQTTNLTPAARIDLSAHHYRFVGIEFASTYALRTQIQYQIVRVGYNSSGQPPSQVSALPDNIIFDRCYFHGTTTGNLHDAMVINAKSFAIMDSYITDVHIEGGESHGLQFLFAPGPLKIDNNYIEAAGINLFFGDNFDIADQFLPTDITVTGNHLYKPWSWKVGDSSYAGIHWLVKNLLELKAARRILIEGNLLEHNWLDAQSGYGVVFTPRGGTVSDVTFRKNVMRGSYSGFTITAADKAMWNILLNDNLLYNINYRLFVSSAASGGTVTDLTIRHNTMVGNVTNALMYFEAAIAVNGFVVYDNILENGSYGVLGTGKGSGLPTITYFTTGYDWNNNVIIGGQSSQYATDSMFRGFRLAADNAAVGFEGSALTAIEDFRLSTSSPYKGKGTDSKDMGADIDAILTAMNNSPKQPAAPQNLREMN